MADNGVSDTAVVSPVETMKVQKPKTTFKGFTFIRLFFAANPTKLDITLFSTGVFFAICSGIPFPLLGIIFGELVDNLNTATCSTSQDSAANAVYQAAVNTKVLQVVYITIANFCFIYIHIVCWSCVGERLAQRLRDQYFRSLLRQEASFFDNLPAGEVSSRLNGDIATIQSGTSEKVGIVIYAISFFITAYIVAFIKDAKLAGMLISLVPAFFIMSLVGGRFTKKYAGEMSEDVASASSIASEGLSNVSVVHAFGANARIEGKFSAYLMKAQKAGIKKAAATAIQTGFLYFTAYAGNGLAFWQGARTIADSVGSSGAATSVGTTYTVIFILVDASLILSQVAPFLQMFASAAGSFMKLENDMNHVSPLDGTSETIGNCIESVSGELELKNVSFTYPSRPEDPVINNLSFKCPAGKHTAIVGLSGSGKSTIASLVARLYDPQEGSVCLDGEDIKNINLRVLRGFVSLVQQDPSLLDRSILENIALGLINSPLQAHAHLKETLLGPELSQLAEVVRGGKDMMQAARDMGSEVAEIVELIRGAATLSDCITFIDRLEHGLATTVGSVGTLLSGGQQQKISLARALVKDPKILVLDEATSSLDSASEQRIQAAIEEFARGRTLVTIAHRLSTVKNADNIIVMKNGEIIEQGTHSELLAINGVYCGMVNLQTLKTQDMDKAWKQETVKSLPDEKTTADEVMTMDEASQNEDDTPPSTPKPAPETPEEVISTPRSTWSIAKSLTPIVRRYLLVLLFAFLTSTIVGASYSAEAVIFGQTVGSLSPCKSAESIRSRGDLFGLLFFILAIVELFANGVSWSAFGFAAEKILYKVRILSFRSLFEQDLQWHESENRNPALLLSYITKDGNALGGLTGSVMGTIFSIAINLVVAIILSLVIAWRIALVCIVTVPILLGAGIMQLRVLSAFEERHEEAFARSTGISVEAVNSIKTVASLSLEHEILIAYRRSLTLPRKEITKASMYANFWLAIANSVSNLVYALAYWWGAKQIIAGNSNQVQFFTVLLALLVSAQLWGQMFLLAPDLSKAKAAIGRILNLIELGSTRITSSSVLEAAPRDIENGSIDLREFKDRVEGEHGMAICFQDVAFAYPARPQIPVLHSLTLNILPGQFCALVGPSGAGKSTIISLIERMYTPGSGSITLDTLPLASRGVSFRDDISIVPQSCVLFDGSIAFNVGLGARPDVKASQQEIEAACCLANIHDTITSLPQGYETHIGPNGSQLSGGQKQRLSIARALVRKPRLLLLDESTSALDAESEAALEGGLEKVRESGMTVVAIAHRLHTIRKADVIFLIEAGRCVANGTHEELMQSSDGYRVNARHQGFEG